MLTKSLSLNNCFLIIIFLRHYIGKVTVINIRTGVNSIVKQTFFSREKILHYIGDVIMI